MVSMQFWQFRISWALILIIAFSAIILPNVRAQKVSITNLQAPSQALVGEPVRVSFAASYSLGGGLYLGAAIFYEGTDNFVPGRVMSPSCAPQSAAHAGLAECVIVASSLTGVEYFTFELTLPNTIGLIPLEAVVRIEDGAFNLVSEYTQDFAISVVAPNSFVTYLIYLLALVIVGAIVVAFTVSRRRRTTPEETVQNRAVNIQETIVQKKPETAFCINCGSQLPPESKFCNKCGTKQP